jgi:hypothetical protein
MSPSEFERLTMFTSDDWAARTCTCPNQLQPHDRMPGVCPTRQWDEAWDEAGVISLEDLKKHVKALRCNCLHRDRPSTHHYACAVNRG